MKQDTKESIDNYVEHGIPPGGFVGAVLANDLMESFGSADLENRTDLFEIVGYVYNDIPGSCHGSYKIVNNWIASKQKERDQKED